MLLLETKTFPSKFISQFTALGLGIPLQDKGRDAKLVR
jgi:hypothetical protein